MLISSQKSIKFGPTKKETPLSNWQALTVIVFCIPHPLNKIATMGVEKLLTVTYLEKILIQN